MAAKSKADKELWRALEGLDDDLLNPDLPEAAVDEELRGLGLDPAALAEQGRRFVVQAREGERLAWQTQARERQAQLQALAARAGASVPAGMGRRALLARLDELRAADPAVGTAIKMAARKRKPEESTDDELRVLLEEMEALRALEGGGPT
jgi:hypothetical protein